MPFVKNGELVAPGQPLCVIEEFVPGRGTYEENGIVRAAIMGVVRIDMVNYQIEVRGKVIEQNLPSTKDVVIGYILGMRDELAMVKITKSLNHALKNMIFTGALHISQASGKGYLSTLYEGFKPGDLVKLKVLGGPPYVLTAKGARLGVILAYCSVCGSPLYLTHDNKLKCRTCGNVENRILSSEYILRLKE